MPAEQLWVIPSKVSRAQRDDTILCVKELLIKLLKNMNVKISLFISTQVCGGGILRLLQKAYCVQAKISLQNNIICCVICIFS